MAKLDYDALRAQTMGAGNDEAVTVNTRALIDKVLARYSGEWTTLRELLQNAADASASKVIIKFETSPSPTVPVPQSSDPSAQLKHVLLHHTLKSTIVENNGEVFKGTDWSRLKKIAEGNPDETKIGAFGVGFYSVFADCEEPFVSSGKEALAFYWQKDALFTKSLALPNGQTSNTTFVLPMRNRTSPIPSLLSLCQFLTSSLTFVGLESIEMWLDEWRIITLNKKVAPSVDLEIPQEVERKTREGLMHVAGVTKEAAQLDAHWLKAVEWRPKAASNNLSVGSGSTVRGAQSSQSLRGFFSRLAPGASNSAALDRAAKEEKQVQESLEEDLMGDSNATIFLHVNKATVRTLVTQSFSSELERATKKPPPKSTTVSLLSASYDEQVASTSSGKASMAPKIFGTFIPTDGKGRVFIGFTTNQTTGLNVHISTPSIIPTVERESIDLNNRFIRVWNVELLRVAGIVARVSWGNETLELREKFSRILKLAERKHIMKDDIVALLPETLYLHSTFTWNESTPSSEVGTLMEEAFWTCNQKTTIATLSTQGVLPSSQVRIAPEELGFVEGIPLLPEALAGVGIIKKLMDYGVITEVTMSDIKSELEGKALDAAQLRRFLEWLGHKAKINEIDDVTIRSLLDVAVANDSEDDSSGRVIVLAEMKHYLNVSRIPPEMPIPPNTLPFKFTKKISKPELEMLGFEDLQLVPWLRWLIGNIGGRGDLSTNQDITMSAAFASSVLPIVSKQWDGLSQSSKSTVIELLTPRTVIPTKMGMRKPAESYFPSVKLFDDLPVVTGLHSVKDKFLTALQVRKTIDIGVVFDRLMDLTPSTASNKTQIPASSRRWSHVDLIKYLASVQNDIPAADIKRLRAMKLCPAETEALQPSAERYQASELFEPDQVLRRLKLRTMHWPGIYHPESQEGKFLKILGLRPYPGYTDLVQIMSTAAASGDLPLRDQALRYFVDYHQTRGYSQYDHSSVTSGHLPIEGSEKKVATPNNCFSNERAAIMGFDILRRDLHVHALKFGVKPDPPIAECVSRLISNPPQSKRNAREVFAYFASRLSEMHDRYAETLSGASVVPVAAKSSSIASPKSENPERIVHIPPRICFLGDGEKYADIFDYVDFGQEANTFLLRVGSKHEPSTTELTKLLVREPARIFSVLGDTRYLELLRSVATSWRTLKKDKALVKDMKAAKCLLAYREISSKGDYEEEEESGIKSWELAKASQVVIVDDIITYNLFKSSLLAAPMEEILEEFYHSLGAPEVSSLLEEQQSIGMVSKDQSSALKLQSLLQERSRLFLHDYPSEMVKHNAKWIEQNLKVKCVQTIALRRSLQGYSLSHRESRSAVVHSDKPILYIISKGYDMLEVSQALVPVLLQRSKPQYIFMLEMILESSLHKLRSRGYNVGKIMQQKETEARIADEALKQQQEEQQREIREREAAWKEAHAASAAKAQQNAMPGIFPDSPDRPSVTGPVEEEPIIDRPRGLISGIRKQFGFDYQRHSVQNSLASRGRNPVVEVPQEDAPPPYSQNEGRKSQAPKPQPETVTAPHHLQQNLLNAIQASRAHNSTSVMSQPAVNDVKEAGESYCDARPGQDISFIGETSKVRIFLSNTVVANGLSATKFMEANVSALKLFATILLDCADIFALNRSTVHIFYDDAGSTIAFNQNKALFFNYRYFENLHLPLAQQGNKTDAIVYWCVVMAHELSHNLVSDHSAQHSYYTEAMVIQYFGKIASKIGGQQPSSSTGAPILPPDPVRSTNL